MASTMALFGLGSAAAGAAGAAGTAAGTTTTAGALASAFEGATLIGSALSGASALSSILSSGQQRTQLKAQSINAQAQAAAAETEAAQKANLLREQALRDAGSSNAAFAARGLTGTGTPAQLMAESFNQANRAASIETMSGKITALGHTAQAAEYKKASKSSLLNGVLDAAGTLAMSPAINRLLGN